LQCMRGTLRDPIRVGSCTVLLLLLLFILEIERGTTRSHSAANSLCKRLWTCRKTDNKMNECTNQSVNQFTIIYLIQAMILGHVMEQALCGCHVPCLKCCFPFQSFVLLHSYFNSINFISTTVFYNAQYRESGRLLWMR
jgi:hypothetical protein